MILCPRGSPARLRVDLDDNETRHANWNRDGSRVALSSPWLAIAGWKGRPTRPLPVSAQTAAATPVSPQRALIDQYCLGCHSDRVQIGRPGAVRIESGRGRPARRDCREGDPQAARRSDAAGWRQAPGQSVCGRRSSRGSRTRSTPARRDRAARTRAAAPPQPPRVRERRPRSARAQHRREGAAAGRQRQGPLRQQRRRPAGVAQLRRPVHLRRARGRARGGRQPQGACR